MCVCVSGSEVSILGRRTVVTDANEARSLDRGALSCFLLVLLFCFQGLIVLFLYFFLRKSLTP